MESKKDGLKGKNTWKMFICSCITITAQQQPQGGQYIDQDPTITLLHITQIGSLHLRICAERENRASAGGS